MNQEIENLLFDAVPININWINNFKQSLSKENISTESLIKIIQNRYEENSNQKDAYSRMGFFELKKNNYQKAKNLFETDIAQKKSSPSMKQKYIEVLFKGEEKICIEWIEQCYKEHPHAKDFYALLARFFELEKNNKKALYYYEKDLELNKMNPGHMRNFGVLLYLDDQKEKALKLIDEAYSKNHLLTDGYALIAWRYYWPKIEIAKAIEYLEKDYNEKTISVTFVNHLAFLFAYSQRFEEATKLIEKIYKENPQATLGYSRIALAYLRPRNYLKAVEYFTKDIDLNKSNLQMKTHQVEILAKLKLFKECELKIETLYKEYPEASNLYASIANSIEDTGNYKRQLFYYRKDIALEKLSDQEYLNYALTLFREDNQVEALNLIEEIYQKNPEANNGYALIGWKYYWPKSNIKKALEYFEKDRKRKRLSDDFKLNLAELYAFDQKHEASRSLVESVYKSNHRLKNGYARIALQLFDSKKEIKAMKNLFDKDLTLNRLSEIFLNEYAQILSDTGEYKKAHSFFKNLVDNFHFVGQQCDTYDYFSLEKPKEFFEQGLLFYQSLEKQRELTPQEDLLLTKFASSSQGYEKGLESFNSLVNKHKEIKELYYNKNKKNIFYAFYDLNYRHVTFDFLIFLIKCEDHCINNGFSGFTLVFGPGLYDGFRKGYHKAYHQQDLDHINSRFRQIILSSWKIAPHCNGVQTFSSRSEYMELWDLYYMKKLKYPEDYNPLTLWQEKSPMILLKKTPASFKATEESIKYVRQWIEKYAINKKIIVITLREASYEPSRNCNIKEWLKFADDLDKDVFTPVFIRDTEQAFSPSVKPLKNYLTFNEASFNIELRMAINELSYLNMCGVIGGPQALNFYNKHCRYLFFRVTTEDVHFATTKFMSVVLGPKNTELPFATKHQKLVWEEDKFEIIKREFDKMHRLIQES